MTRRARSLVLRAAGSAVLLGVLLRQMDAGRVWGLFRGVHGSWLLAALGVMMLTRRLACARTILLLETNGEPINRAQVSRIVLTSQMLGCVLPTSIGGDMVRVWSLAKHTADRRRSASAVLLERLLGTAALLLLGAAGTLWLWQRLESHRFLLAALVPAAAVLLLAVMLLSRRAVTAGLRRFGVHRSRWAAKLLAWQGAAREFRHHPAVLARVFALSLGMHALRVLAAYVVGLAFGTPIPFGYFAAFVPLALLLAMLPISIGSIGVKEGAFVLAFTQVGVSPELAFAIALVSNALTMLSTVPGGIGWLSRLTVRPVKVSA